MRQNARSHRTEDSLELTPSQEIALQVLLAGGSVAAAAAQARVDRSVVKRWLREDGRFMAAYDEELREMREALSIRLLRLAAAAVATVGDSVKGGDVTSALRILEGLGLLRGVLPSLAEAETEDA